MLFFLKKVVFLTVFLENCVCFAPGEGRVECRGYGCDFGILVRR